MSVHHCVLYNISTIVATIAVFISRKATNWDIERRCV